MKMKFMTSWFLLVLATPVVANSYQKLSDQKINIQNAEESQKINDSIKELKKEVDKKFQAIDILLSINNYNVMKILYEIHTKLSTYNNIKNPPSELVQMREQLERKKGEFNVHSENGDNDPDLAKYFQQKHKLDKVFDSFKEALEALEDQKSEEQTKKFSSKKFLKENVGQYDLALREFAEIGIEKVIENHVFSWKIYMQYREIKDFISGDSRKVFHGYIREFITVLNKKFAKLVAELDKIDHSKIDSEKEFKEQQRLYNELIDYREEITYLVTEDFKAEFPILFMELETFLQQAKTYMEDLDNKIIISYTEHFTQWNKTFTTQKAKVTEEGVWEKIVALNKKFNESHNHYKKFRQTTKDMQLNFADSDFALKTLVNNINTIEYRGVDKIFIKDPENNPTDIIYYKAEDTYAAWRANEKLTRDLVIYVGTAIPDVYITSKWVYQPLSQYISKNGRIVSWTSYKYFPKWAPKWLGRVGGFVGSAVAGGAISVAIDLIFGNLLIEALNNKWISKGAGVSFEVKNTRWMWVGAYLASSIKDTIKAQPKLYLDKIEI